jgi:hypothetical protein
MQSTIKTANIAYVKIQVNKKLQTVRVLATFDSTKRDKDGNIIVNITNAVFKSGDVATLDTQTAEQRSVSIANTIALAKKVLRTDNILLV